jgi:hypothetical protein
LAIANAQTLSHQCGSPETIFGFQPVAGILGLEGMSCKSVCHKSKRQGREM